MAYSNDNDIAFMDVDLIGAVDMVVTTEDEVACVSEFSRKVVLLKHDVAAGEITVTKSPALEHRVKHITASGNFLYLTAPKNFKEDGFIYVFHKSSLSVPRTLISDDHVNGPVTTHSTLDAFIYSRSDGPSVVARDKTSFAVLDELLTDFIVTDIYIDPTVPGTLYCANASNRTLEIIAWDDTNNRFAHQDPITLPRAGGLLDLIIRGGELLYVTRNGVVHYDPVTDVVEFGYHDFLNKFSSIAAVEGIDYTQTPPTTFPHPNLDGNTSILAVDLMALEFDRLTGPMSRAERDRFGVNPLFEEFGELYGSDIAPFTKQFQGAGPRTLVRSNNNRFISLTPSRGVVRFSGSCVLNLLFRDPSPDDAKDSQYRNDIEWLEEDLVTDVIAPVALPVARVRDLYPKAMAVSLPGKVRQVWGEGKKWAALFYAGSVTVTAWVKPVSDSAGTDRQAIVSNKVDLASGDGFHLSLRIDTGVIEAFGDNAGSSVAESTAGITLTDGNWHHVAVVIGPVDVKVYHNGADVTNTSTVKTIRPSTTPLRIGRLADDADRQSYRGDLSGVQVFTIPLPVARILEIFTDTRLHFGV